MSSLKEERTFQMPTLASSSRRVVTLEKMANRAMIHLSQGVRHRADGCVALGWNLASVVNDPLGAPDSTRCTYALRPDEALRVVTSQIPSTCGTVNGCQE
jgi:hypothetical protein